MGQRRIIIDVSEYQARALRFAVDRLIMFMPPPVAQGGAGGKLFWRKALELQGLVHVATEGLEVIRTYPKRERIVLPKAERLYYYGRRR